MKYVLYTILAVAFLIGLGWLFGLNNVLYTKTVKKEQKDADREVFERSQSYVEGKRQEASKLYREYNEADEDGKEAIREYVANSFANFDETLLIGKLRLFIEECKY